MNQNIIREYINRVVKEYQFLEANVDQKYLGAEDYMICKVTTMDDMEKEGLITKEDRKFLANISVE